MHYAFPCIGPLTHNPYFIMVCIKKGHTKNHFLSL